MKPPLPLDDRLDRVTQHIIRARLFLDLWFYFEGENTRSRIIETMQDYSEFFRFTPHAYLVSYVIYMAGAFDASQGTISLKHLVSEVMSSGPLNDEDVVSVRTLMAEADPIVNKLRTLRHKAFAHKDAHISYNNVFKIAAITPDQLRELTEIALKVAERLLLARGTQSPILHQSSPRGGGGDDEGVGRSTAIACSRAASNEGCNLEGPVSGGLGV